ncbi:MAG TPA: zinc metalloprotease HtpX [Methanomicrobiales archaeon]|nr:zinc metalloprotease HtpX [Methanomicrobiales archaeon]
MQWTRDFGLTWRMWMTMLLLLLVYLVFIAILYAIGIPPVGLIVISAGLVLLQYFFSDRLVLFSTRARVVSEEEYPDLHQMVEKLAAEAGLPKPKVAVMPSPVPNAFATGRDPHHAVVAVTDSIMRVLNRDELEAVLAHEMSHVKNRDMMVLTIASFVSMLAAIIMRSAIFASFGGRRDNGAWVIAWIAAILVWVVATLLISALSRYREFAADRGSGILTQNPRSLISALTKISNRMDSVPPEKKQEVSGANAFYIIPAISRETIFELFMTHPTLEKRVAALEDLERELQGY